MDYRDRHGCLALDIARGALVLCRARVDPGRLLSGREDIYTEPFVLPGGGPGNSTTLLSIDLVKIALGQFDLGPAAAMSLIYFAITLLVSWVFYTLMTKDDQQ